MTPTLVDSVQTPTFGVLLTLLGYALGLLMHRICRCHPIAHPTLIAITAIAITLQVTGIGYDVYLRGAAMISFLLGPAVVLLAVPLVRNLAAVGECGRAVAISLFVGASCGIGSAVGLAWALGSSTQMILSVAPKSVTTGIAIDVSNGIGGIGELTAVIVIATGIVGAISGPVLARSLKVTDDRALGIALGIASHGIGTARAIQIGDRAAAFATTGMALNGLLTALLVPMLLALDLPGIFGHLVQAAL